MMRLKLIYCTFFILMAQSSIAQSFEGIIKFKFYTPIDTSHYIYYEKDGLVKIEEYTFDNRLKNFIVFDLKSMKATTFYPERQVFFVVDNYFSGNSGNYELKLEKGKKSKIYASKDCQEWIIKSKAQNVAATFYVMPSNYEFSKSLLPILQKKDKVFRYFMHFPELNGFLPMYVSEMGSGKNQRFAFEITSFGHQALLLSEFQFPKGYKLHE
ncbi:MAG: hypothetical protein H0X62_08575 [Bacteroidetes bacterium]|nr:hypothetical protein [Bacteroidota bacterium]